MELNQIGDAVEIYRGMRLEQRKLAHLPEGCALRDSLEAYEVQNALNARLADLGLGAISGHKIGCTSKVMQEYLKIDQPCSGGIYANTVFHGHGARAHALYCEPGVECEIAVRLGVDLAPEGAPYHKDNVAEAVESQARELVAEGADVIVVGCCATGPFCSAAGFSSFEEGGRRIPVIDPVVVTTKLAESAADLRDGAGLPFTTFAQPSAEDIDRVHALFEE